MVEQITFTGDTPAPSTGAAKADWLKAAGAALSSPADARPTTGSASPGTQRETTPSSVRETTASDGRATSPTTAQNTTEINGSKAELQDKPEPKVYPEAQSQLAVKRRLMLEQTNTTEAFNGAVQNAVSDAVRQHLRNGWQPGSERELSAAIREAVQTVLQNPQWQERFNNDIDNADATLQRHPKIALEIKDAKKAVQEAGEESKRLENKYAKEISSLPEPVQQKLKQLEEMDAVRKFGTPSLVDQYLKKNFPNIYDTRLGMQRAQQDLNNKQQELKTLEQVRDKPVQARLAAAEFLLQRGGKGDDSAAIALLGQVVDADPNGVRDQYFPTMLNLIERSGALHDKRFLKTLEENGIDPMIFERKIRQTRELKLQSEPGKKIKPAKVLDLPVVDI